MPLCILRLCQMSSSTSSTFKRAYFVLSVLPLSFSYLLFRYNPVHMSTFELTLKFPQIENGDKIIMPPSALDRLGYASHIDYPMLFELRNAATERVSHCGVLDFVAEEGMVYMPCPCAGDSSMVAYNNRKYYIDIIEAKPSNGTSIIETDCEMDLVAPLDYKEPGKPKSQQTKYTFLAWPLHHAEEHLYNNYKRIINFTPQKKIELKF
ncbi:hypothetical protein DCAR_0102862 [Daucus carota subsp. sativus]|uniref:Uncharacterized protein n=1 Tax=Daucus carota subsp. sativus TaxID=79200 RepID=A0AAF1AKR8_DAUCS|nr:hypothetical protein DCAR_0102862 [Daucus carota subsp. sativus]